jgi:hypothetical protein
MASIRTTAQSRSRSGSRASTSARTVRRLFCRTRSRFLAMITPLRLSLSARLFGPSSSTRIVRGPHRWSASSSSSPLPLVQLLLSRAQTRYVPLICFRFRSYTDSRYVCSVHGQPSSSFRFRSYRPVPSSTCDCRSDHRTPIPCSDDISFSSIYLCCFEEPQCPHAYSVPSRSDCDS